MHVPDCTEYILHSVNKYTNNKLIIINICQDYLFYLFIYLCIITKKNLLLLLFFFYLMMH